MNSAQEDLTILRILGQWCNRLTGPLACIMHAYMYELIKVI